MRTIVLLAALALGVADCGPEQASQPAAGGLAFVRCGDVEPEPDVTRPPRHLHCAQLSRRDSAGNDQILQLLLVSDRTEAPLTDRKVLVYHPGGPGISAMELTEQDPPDVDLGRWVVLAWDGTTASTNRGSCGPLSSRFGVDRTAENLAGDAPAVGHECLQGFGGPEDVGAEAAAEELEDIRSILGVERLDLLTLSYGTAIAEVYLRTQPHRVGRAVLDGPMALEVSWADRLGAVGAALATESSAIAASCRTERCTALAGAQGGVTYATLRRAILGANPVVGGGQTALTPTMFDQAALLSLRSEASWAGWSNAIDAALGGDATDLWAIAEKEYFDLDRAVFYRSLCADIHRPPGPAAYGLMADDLLRTYASALAPCVAFPDRDLPAPAGGASPQVLLVASPHDVLTPAALLASADELRELGTVCMTDVVGHTSYRDAEVGALEIAFLATGDTGAGICER